MHNTSFQPRKSFRLIFLLILAGIVLGGKLFAQVENKQRDSLFVENQGDSIIVDTSYHDPRKAVVYSAILPGLGQIYNKKIWKAPIVYAGFGTFIYFIDRNQRYYFDLKSKLLDPDYELKYFDGVYTDDQLKLGMDTYKRWRDLSIIGTFGFYVLQILDATVDAYLFDWDVDENISLKIEPASLPNPYLANYSLGIRASLSF